jgi:hypothetical protein
MADKLSRTKELVAIDGYKVETLSPQRSKLPIMPFATLLPPVGSITTLYNHADELAQKVEELEGDNSKEYSMLQQVMAWLKMGE